jgi:hypothetical protein
MSRSIALLFLAIVLSCSTAYTKDSKAVQKYYQDKKNIRNVVAVYLNHYYNSNKYFGEKSYDFRNIDKKDSKYSLTSLEIEMPWALAVVTPRRQNPPEPFVPDGAGFLLKKQKGRWQVLGMGTSLDGFGKKFGVPKRLWRKWLLE